MPGIGEHVGALTQVKIKKLEMMLGDAPLSIAILQYLQGMQAYGSVTEVSLSFGDISVNYKIVLRTNSTYPYKIQP